MKKCPTCDQMCPDDAIFCRQCGEKFPETEKGSSVGISEGNTSTGGVHMNDVHSDSDGRDDMDAPNSDVNISGDDNVTYVSKTTNKTNSDNVHKTNSDNTTINNYWPQKSKGELQEEDLLRYRLKCKEFYKNGLISKDAEEQLHELQVKLCLADEHVLPIKKEIQQMSRVPSTELSLGVIAGINNTKSIIEQNSSDAIRRHLRQLESWMQVYDDDSLRSWCCQLSSMLDPVQFTERFEQSAKDEYWHRYWAHIAYMLQNKEEQAYEASSCLGLLQANHPEHDEVLLLLVGRLIQNEPIESIENEFNTGALFCSQELQLLCDTINELLHKKWSQLWDVIPGTFQVRWSGKPEVRPAHSFYANNLFKSFVNTQIEAGKKQREEEERIRRGEEEINRQKGYLLEAFGKVEDIDKACADLSIPYLTFKKWQEEDDIFNSKYNAIVRHIEDKRNEEAEKIRIVRQQKTQFLSQYKKNDCDFIGTCSEQGLGSDVVQTWRGTDKVFDDGLTIIEREHEKKLQELFIRFYESNGCELQKASAETGVSVDIVNGWRKSNKSYNEVLISIENEHVQAQKDAFAKCYDDNGGEFLKTCNEIGISQDAVKGWMDTDSSFNNSIGCIKRKYDAKRRKKNLAVVIPCILIAILSVVIGRQLKSSYDTRRETAAAINRYTEATANLRGIIETIPNNVNDISIEKHFNALLAGSDSLKSIVVLEQKSQIAEKEESKELRNALLEKANIVLEYAKNLYATSSDVPEYKSERQTGHEFIKKIDNLKQNISNK